MLSVMRLIVQASCTNMPRLPFRYSFAADRRVVDADRVRHAVAIELHEVAVDVVLEHVVAEAPS